MPEKSDSAPDAVILTYKGQLPTSPGISSPGGVRSVFFHDYDSVVDLSCAIDHVDRLHLLGRQVLEHLTVLVRLAGSKVMQILQRNRVSILRRRREEERSRQTTQ